MKTPEISIIVPAYNEEYHILPCLKSITELDFPKDKYEIVVVNNNSSDNTEKIIKANYPEVKIIEEKKQGVVFARIRGVEKAKGKIIAFTDADCLVPKEWLNNIYNAFRDPNVVAVGGTTKYQTNSFIGKISTMYLDFHTITIKLMSGYNMSFRKSAYLKCGGFSEKINFGEDAYISQKLKEVGKLVMLKDNPMVTSIRRQASLNVINYCLKGIFFLISLLIFNKPLSFNFKPIRTKTKK